MRILIAEDEPVSRASIEATLRSWGHEVIVASDGEEAWRILQRPDAPKIILLDWVMPGMSGPEICRKVRQREDRIRPCIILLTAMDEKDDLIEGLGAGADDYVTKPFDPGELKARIQAMERILDLQIKLLQAEQSLRRDATHDPLTGFSNRTLIFDQLVKEIARAARTATDISVVMIDMDRFKDVNDTHGHAVGDAVLVEAVKRIATEIRTSDSIGRYGGDEFLVVLCDCDLQGALRQAERLRQAVSAGEFDAEGVRLQLTISLGVASTSQLSAPTPDKLLKLADKAVYRAKAAGRNRVETASAEQLANQAAGQTAASA